MCYDRKNGRPFDYFLIQIYLRNIHFLYDINIKHSNIICKIKILFIYSIYLNLILLLIINKKKISK